MTITASQIILEVGKIADLVVLPSNPMADISTLKSPAAVVKGGILVTQAD